MGMQVGGGSSRRVQPSMNVTPLVDVVLVLLIIFMVVTPLMVKSMWLNVPKRAEAAAPSEQPPVPPLVLVVRRDGSAELDKEQVSDAVLHARIVEGLRGRPDRAVLFGAMGDVPYGRAMDVLDIAKGAGTRAIAIIPDEVKTP